MSLEFFLKDIKTMSNLRCGKFGPYIDAYAQRLRDNGYNNEVACLQIRLIGDFERWLNKQHVPIAEITLSHINRFARNRGRRRAPTGCDVSAPTNFLDFLLEIGAITTPGRNKNLSLHDSMLESFRQYMIQERANALSTVTNYQPFIRDFLEQRFASSNTLNYEALAAGDVVRFVQRHADRYGKRAKLMVSALRAFFRFLQYKGHTRIDLSSTVPSVAQWSRASLPQAISPDQIERVISSRQGLTAVKRRDLAMLLLLARLGLRAGEVVSLRLEDIDWRQGCITVRGKGGTATRMPLPEEVGRALAEYVSKARPKTKLRSLFLSVRAPIRALKPASLSTRVMTAFDELGISSPKRGAHTFRHSLATNMLRSGCSLAEIAELLRHRSTQTTEVYAKVDINALRELALRWPGGAQ